MAVTSSTKGRGRAKTVHFQALSTDIKPGHHKWIRGGEDGLTSTLEIIDTGARYIRVLNEWVLVFDPAQDAVELGNLKSRLTDAEQNNTALLARVEALESKGNGP